MTPSKKRSVRAKLCGAAFLLYASPALADDDVDVFNVAPEQLFDATVVSVSRAPESLWNAPAAVYVITSQDIERAGATTIADALRLAPGVEVAQISAASWAVSVRGFNGALANKLLVLVDGREVYDPLFSGVYWDSIETPLADIERIEIVRGPGAVMWGANAVNGVINIITKNARDTQGWSADATLGAGGEQDYALRYGGTAGERVSWRAFGRLLDRPASQSLNGADANDAWRFWRAGLRLDAQLSESDDLTLEAETYASDTGDLRAAPLFAPPFSVLAPEDLDARGGDILMRWTHASSRDSQFALQAYINFDQHDRLTLDDGRTTFDVDAQYQSPTFGVHKLIAGVGYRNTSDDPDNTLIIQASQSTIEEERVSAFLQDRITLVPGRWVLTLGSKFEQQRYSGFQIQPNIRLQWFDGDIQTAWTSIARAIRSPSEIEREYNIVLATGQPTGFPVPVSIDLVPNPNFGSEEVIAYEAGYRRRLAATVTLDVSAFYNQYSGLATNVMSSPTISTDPVVHLVLPIDVVNATSADVYGVEALARWTPTDALSFEFDYSFLDLDVNGPASGAVDANAVEGRSPKHRASARVHWDYSHRSALDVTLYLVGGLRDFDIPAYSRLDLRWSTAITPSMRFEVVGQNLLDNTHREFTDPSDPAATEVERSVYGRVVWQR